MRSRSPSFSSSLIPTRCVGTIFGLADQAGESPIVVCAFVGMAVRSMGLDVVEELVEEHPEFFDDDQLGKLQDVVADLSVDRSFDMSSERQFFMDIIQRTFSMHRYKRANKKWPSNLDQLTGKWIVSSEIVENIR